MSRSGTTTAAGPGRRPPRRVRRYWPALLAAVALLLAGCVSVPTSGPIEKINAQEPACQNCVSVEVNPPAPGDEPQQIVESFLRATSNYQPNYSVARQYLTKAAAQRWSPEDGATVYTGTVVATGSSVVLTGTTIGRLAPDRTYTAGDKPLSLSFGLVQEDGEWRIDAPPAGLMVERSAFTSFYRGYDLYFIGNGSVLVPDLIYLPSGRTQTSLASVLVTSLLGGASSWLKPAVSSAIPAGTELSVDSVPVNNGIAEVPLSENVLQLNDQQRGLMATQVAYTLRQVPGINAVLFTVNQQPFRVPYGTAPDFSMPVDAVPAEVEPLPFVAGGQLYVVRDNAVEVVDTDQADSTPQPVPGPLGQGDYPVDSLAVSVADTDLAVVSHDRTRLSTTATSGGALTPLLRGARSLLRPQFSRFDEVWAIGQAGSRQRVWVFAGNKQVEVDASELGDARIRAFKLAPDGVRMALILSSGDRTQLALARISRGERIVVDGLRVIDTTQSTSADIRHIRDIAWLDSNNILLLGAESARAVLSPYVVSQDAYRITVNPEPSTWDVDEITIVLSSQTAVVVGSDGQTWKDDGRQWLPYLDKVESAAAPG